MYARPVVESRAGGRAHRPLLAALTATTLVLTLGGVAAPANAADGNVGITIMPASADFFGDSGQGAPWPPPTTIKVFDADGDGSTPLFTVPADSLGLLEPEWLTLPDGRYKVRADVEGYLPTWAGLVEDGGVGGGVDQFAGLVDAFYDLHPTLSFTSAPVLEVETGDESLENPAYVAALASRSASFIGGILIPPDQDIFGEEGHVELFRVGWGTPLMSQATVGNTYVFDNVPTGKFQLRFTFDGQEQWWPFESERAHAAVLQMTAGAGGRAALNANFGAPVAESVAGEHLTITGDAVEGGLLTLLSAPRDPFENPELLGSEELSQITWLQDGAPIAGQHGMSLVVPAGSEGSEISATAVFSQLVGYFVYAVATTPTGPVVASSLPVLNPAPTPVIPGSPQVGVQLQATVGTWGPGATTKAIQWNLDGIPIAGATTARYTPKGTDAGSQLSVTVTASKTGYQTTSRTSDLTDPVAETLFTATPVPTLAPLRVRDAPRVGDTIRAVHGNWAPNPETFAYQWLRDGVPIDGAIASSHAITPDDLGSVLAVQVTGIRAGYTSVTVESLQSGVVGLGVFTGQPVIVPAPQVGVESTLDLSAIVPVADAVVSVEWKRGANATVLGTGMTYTPSASDAGRNLRAFVTVAKEGYVTVARASDAVAVLP